MTDEELDAIFAHAKEQSLELNLTHLKLEHEGLWSVPIPAGGACPLLDSDERCSVHPVKPWQCRAYPFWPEVMKDRASWDEEATFCEGMNRGPGHTPEHIDAIMRQDPFLEE